MRRVPAEVVLTRKETIVPVNVDDRILDAGIGAEPSNTASRLLLSLTMSTRGKFESDTVMIWFVLPSPISEGKTLKETESFQC